MVNHPYYAVLYAYDPDGSVKAEMPCFTEEQVLLRASKYPKVRVVPKEGAAFWLRAKLEVIAPAQPDIAPPMNGVVRRSYDGSGSMVIQRPALSHTAAYDGWKSRSK